MKHTLKYVKTGLWYRPIIPVTLRFNKIEFNYLALLDSGADFNIFHADIAKILKLDLSKLKNLVDFSGINGRGIGYFTSLDIGIENDFINNTPVVFSNDISENGYGILGQQGFFNNFKIEFSYKTKNIILTPNK
ncbi:MAG: retropepsin-like domain-containing protein [Candidatus Levybacteria bacterium]|nr:retropepsin-like domain-containing protein [Candidatus Levybacteria bacterium]